MIEAAAVVALLIFLESLAILRDGEVLCFHGIGGAGAARGGRIVLKPPVAFRLAYVAADGPRVDAAGARALLSDFLRATRRLRIAGLLYSLTAVLLVGLLAADAPEVQFWLLPPFLGWMVLLHVWTTAETWLAARALGFPSGKRWWETLLSFVSPFHAMRSPEQFSLRLLAGFHPLVVAFVVGRREHAMRGLRRLTYEDEAAAERLTPGILAACGLLHEDCFRPPLRDAGSASYCPVCLAQYVRPAGLCEDCGVERNVFES